MRIALDTNILGYIEGVNGDERKQEAFDLVGQLPDESIVIPDQVLLELFNVLVRKAGWTRAAARTTTARWIGGYQPAATSSELLIPAMDLAVRYGFQIFDAMILAAAAQAKCGLLLTEDMHDGFMWNGVTITNPFRPNRHIWLDMLLSEGQP